MDAKQPFVDQELPEFVNPPQDPKHPGQPLLCGICQNTPLSPASTDCEGCLAQVYCQRCLRSWLLKSNSCPHCRKSNPNLVPIPYLDQIINSCEVLCPQCSQKVILKNLHNEKHATTCPKTLAACEFAFLGCAFKTQREKLNEHYADPLALHHHLLLQTKKEITIWGRGSGFNQLQLPSHQRAVHLGNLQLHSSSNRGLNLTVLSAVDLSVLECQTFDTHKLQSEGQKMWQRLRELQKGNIFIITGFDAWENFCPTRTISSLSPSLSFFASYYLNGLINVRHPLAMIGVVGGEVSFALRSSSPHSSFADVWMAFQKNPISGLYCPLSSGKRTIELDGLVPFAVGEAGERERTKGNAHRAMIEQRTDEMNERGWTPKFHFFAFNKPGAVNAVRFAVGEAGGGPRPTHHPHRCMIDQREGELNGRGWKHKLHFYAWLTPMPGTVRFAVGEAGGGNPDITHNPHSIMIEMTNDDLNHSGWKHLLHFYAFPSPVVSL